MLSGIKGKTIVTYYPDQLATALYAEWKIVEIPSKLYSEKVQSGESKPEATELLLLNYDSGITTWGL